jgi:hypothetical protein
MTPDDRNAFLETVLGFAELKGKQLSAPALELYWRSMQAWELGEFKAAAEQLLRTCEFMPLPKDFEDVRKASRPAVSEAWAAACRFARSLYYAGRYRAGSMGDRAVDLAVQSLGGYPAIAMCDEDKLHFLEKQFAERYSEARDVVETRAALGYDAEPVIDGRARLQALREKVGALPMVQKSREPGEDDEPIHKPRLPRLPSPACTCKAQGTCEVCQSFARLQVGEA